MKLARAWLVVVLAVPGKGLLAGSGVEPRTAIELFSGIGGMRAALAAADPSWRVAEAFDVNELANRVYRDNWRDAEPGGASATPRCVGLEHASAALLGAPRAALWLLSPPCQPYAAIGARRDADDPRARALHAVADALRALAREGEGPELVLLENVLPFARSRSRARVLDALAALGRARGARAHYEVYEFALSPSQFGVPNARPRYYLAAARRALRGESYRRALAHRAGLIVHPLRTARARAPELARALAALGLAARAAPPHGAAEVAPLAEFLERAPLAPRARDAFAVPPEALARARLWSPSSAP